MTGCRYRVTGVVQGVGFRAFTARAASALGVVGWCRNTIDGAVVGEAFGDEAALQTFIGRLRVGPVSAVVSDVAVEPVEDAFAGDTFMIRR